MMRIEKREGETLAELVERVRFENNIAADVPITYAGRLDPMASGEMIMLVGADVHLKDSYIGIDKEYEFDIAFGVTSDTLDALGIVRHNLPLSAQVRNMLTADELARIATEFVGEYEQAYPAYSSKPIEGVPSFVHARAGNRVEAPRHKVVLRSVEVIATREVRAVDLAREAIERVGCVSGDFRQEAVVDSWREFSHAAGAEMLIVASLRATVGSGFYIRTFAEELAAKAGTIGMAWRIRRTRCIIEE